jgi:hypothetical protein
MTVPVVQLSVALGYYVSQAWFVFTAFVEPNLFQSAFTDWCPMVTFLRKAGGGPSPESEAFLLPSISDWTLRLPASTRC